MMGKDEIKNKSSQVDEGYFFPEHQITIQATSIEEAEEKLKTIINKK